MTVKAHREFIPASGHDLFLPLYDPFVKLIGGDRIRKRLLELADIRPGHRLLDIGCGTGTLAILAKRLHPGAEIIGLDPDPKALARARRKAHRAKLALRLDRGFADELPYADGSFDRVLSTFMFHHLQGEEKVRTLREVRRVLEPGGSLLLLDFEGPESDEGGWLARRLHSSHLMEDNSEDRVLDLMRQAGFPDPRTVDRGALFFVWRSCLFYRAAAPAPKAVSR
jgi:ubiquinone/menaquinone biosynthesis C-methylase UbiE